MANSRIVMAHAHPQPPCDGGGGGGGEWPIKVGTTGTISSLMSRELDSIKQTNPPCSTLKYQPAPVSVPCGFTPRRLHQRRYPSSDAGSSSSSGSSTAMVDDINRSGYGKEVKESRKSSRQRENGDNGSRAPMLTPDRAVREVVNGKGGSGKRTAHSFMVEVVDLKCNNPMSGRLKKLGFSKLSESIA